MFDHKSSKRSFELAIPIQRIGALHARSSCVAMCFHCRTAVCTMQACALSAPLLYKTSKRSLACFAVSRSLSCASFFLLQKPRQKSEQQSRIRKCHRSKMVPFSRPDDERLQDDNSRCPPPRSCTSSVTIPSFASFSN